MKPYDYQGWMPLFYAKPNCFTIVIGNQRIMKRSYTTATTGWEWTD